MSTSHRKARRRQPRPLVPPPSAGSLVQAILPALIGTEPTRRITRISSHLSDFGSFSDECCDLVHLLADALLRSKDAPRGHGKLSWVGLARCRTLNKTFKAAADAWMHATLGRLRKALLATRHAFQSFQLARPPYSGSLFNNYERRCHLVHAGIHFRAESMAYSEYFCLLYTLFSEAIAQRLAEQYLNTAEWSSDIELVAWRTSKCVVCRKHNAAANEMHCPVAPISDIRHTTCHAACAPWISDRPIAHSKRLLQRRALVLFDACPEKIHELLKQQHGLGSFVWVDQAPGIPKESTMVGASNLDESEIAELVAQHDAEEAERAAKRAATRLKRRDSNYDYLEGVATRHLEEHAPELSLSEFQTLEHELDMQPSLPVRPWPSTRRLGIPSWNHLELLRLRFEANLKIMVHNGPELRGVSVRNLFERADAYAAHAAPHLSRLDVLARERELGLTPSLPWHCELDLLLRLDRRITLDREAELFAQFCANVDFMVEE